MVTKPIPMKRELKGYTTGQKAYGSCCVTKPIPMKRELKVDGHFIAFPDIRRGHKANPDEKGTESMELAAYVSGVANVTKPIPMKRELKAGLFLSQTPKIPRSQSQSR